MIAPRNAAMSLFLAGSSLLAACGASGQAAVSPTRETQRLAAQTRSSLVDAAEAARAYGQAQLGHYLDLGLRDLEQEGLRLDEDVVIKVRADHTGFCLIAINGRLPSIHPWATGTISSAATEPSSADRCHR